MEILIFLGVIAFIVWIASGEPPKMYLSQRKCTKQPHLECPATVELTSRGGIKARGQLQCCMHIQNRKEMNELWCRMKPGVSYGDFAITKEFHEEALKNREFYKNLDDSGPLGYNKEKTTEE